MHWLAYYRIGTLSETLKAVKLTFSKMELAVGNRIVGPAEKLSSDPRRIRATVPVYRRRFIFLSKESAFKIDVIYNYVSLAMIAGDVDEEIFLRLATLLQYSVPYLERQPIPFHKILRVAGNSLKIEVGSKLMPAETLNREDIQLSEVSRIVAEDFEARKLYMFSEKRRLLEEIAERVLVPYTF